MTAATTEHIGGGYEIVELSYAIAYSWVPAEGEMEGVPDEKILRPWRAGHEHWRKSRVRPVVGSVNLSGLLPWPMQSSLC